MANEGTDKLKYMVVKLHHALCRVWDIWKEVAIANHLVVVHRQSKGHRRRNIRLFVRIEGARVEKH
jgi:hypothetical protein